MQVFPKHSAVLGLFSGFNEGSDAGFLDSFKELTVAQLGMFSSGRTLQTALKTTR